MLGAGLSSIAASCPVLKKLSLAKNKQLQDMDFETAFKTGLNSLTSLDCSYNNLTGQCFKWFNCGNSLEKINMNCCSNMKNEGVTLLLSRCNNTLRHLDISATKIENSLFSSIQMFHPNVIKTLYIDFCSAVTLQCLQEQLFGAFPCLKVLSMFGISYDDKGGKLIIH